MAFSEFSDLAHALVPFVGPFVVVALVYTLYYLRSPFRKLPYPPGPLEKGLISGNQSDLPSSRPWFTYVEWGKIYGTSSHFSCSMPRFLWSPLGDIIHYRTYNKHTVVLNAYDDNVELLDKRSLIYSDRPYFAMMDLCVELFLSFLFYLISYKGWDGLISMLHLCSMGPNGDHTDVFSNSFSGRKYLRNINLH